MRALREDQLLTKAELARKAGISALTLARIERGQDCRVDTKRKILLALGLKPSDKDRVFGGAARVVGLPSSTVRQPRRMSRRRA